MLNVLGKKRRNALFRNKFWFPLFAYIIFLATVSVIALITTPNLHRIRAALIYREVDAKLINAPTTGSYETKTPPLPMFTSYAHTLLEAGGSFANTWTKALVLARMTRGFECGCPERGLSSVEQKLYDIVCKARGVCSDYTEAYIGLCLVGGIPVREWGITPDQLKGSGGHSTIEIYDTERGGWKLVDPFVSAWPASIINPQLPLSLFEVLAVSGDSVVWHPIMSEYYRPDLIKKFYGKRPLSAFIINSQDIFSPVKVNIPAPALQLLNIIRGKSFHFLVPAIENNEEFLSGLKMLRTVMILAATATIILILWLIVIGFKWRCKQHAGKIIMCGIGVLLFLCSYFLI